MTQTFRLWLAGHLGLILLLFGSAGAVDSDAQTWLPLTLRVEVTPKWSVQLQPQPRWINGLDEMNQFLLQASGEYQATPRWSLGAGYVWSTRYLPSRVEEHRPFQHITHTQPLGRVTLQNRVMVEERVLENVSGPTVRGRHLLRLTAPLKNPDWYGVLSNEVFVHLNSQPNGPAAGFQQDRAFVGVGKKLTPHLQVEGGYQIQYANRPGPQSDRMDHILLLQLSARIAPFRPDKTVPGN